GLGGGVDRPPLVTGERLDHRAGLVPEALEPAHGGGGVGDAAKDAAAGVGQVAKDAATATGQAALAPAVGPVLDLRKRGEGDVKAGNLAAAAATMGGFQGLWDKAGPVIQPLAGDKWGAIDTAAKAVLSTFGGGAQPDAAAAGSAITGLLGPLSALVGK
ncbi:MAG: hypothetical protein ACKOPN_13090, partial [Prochlorococcaceae cyanobacterium]